MTAPTLLRRNDADGLTGPVGFVVWQVNNFNYERSDLHLLIPINATGGVGREKKKAGYIYMLVRECVRETGREPDLLSVLLLLLTLSVHR